MRFYCDVNIESLVMNRSFKTQYLLWGDETWALCHSGFWFIAMVFLFQVNGFPVSCQWFSRFKSMVFLFQVNGFPVSCQWFS